MVPDTRMPCSQTTYVRAYPGTYHYGTYVRLCVHKLIVPRPYFRGSAIAFLPVQTCLLLIFRDPRLFWLELLFVCLRNVVNQHPPPRGLGGGGGMVSVMLVVEKARAVLVAVTARRTSPPPTSPFAWMMIDRRSRVAACTS
jgi:hypothetical protein